MRILPLILASALSGCAASPPSPTSQHTASGVAGAQRCVLIVPSESFRVSPEDPSTLLYRIGRTTWANHLDRCSFRTGDVLVTQPIGSSHCRGDLVRSFDTVTRIPGNACVLGDFVPYAR